METNGKFYMTDMIRSMHYQFNGERLKVITNKMVFVKSFTDVLNHIKSHG